MNYFFAEAVVVGHPIKNLYILKRLFFNNNNFSFNNNNYYYTFNNNI